MAMVMVVWDERGDSNRNVVLNEFCNEESDDRQPHTDRKTDINWNKIT